MVVGPESASADDDHEDMEEKILTHTAASALLFNLNSIDVLHPKGIW